MSEGPTGRTTTTTESIPTTDSVVGTAFARLAALMATGGELPGDPEWEAHQAALSKVREAMSVEAIHSSLSQNQVGNNALAIDPPMGTGKSTRAKDYIASPQCWERYKLVVYLVPSHALARAVADDLARRGLTVYRYPGIDDALCQGTPMGERVLRHKEQGTSALAEREVCHGECPQAADCPYVRRFRGERIPSRYQVVVAPSSLVRARPDQLATWADGRAMLTVLDDTFDYANQYIDRFQASEVADLVRVLEDAHQETGDMARYIAMLRLVAERGERMPPIRFTSQERLSIEAAADRLGVSLARLPSVLRWGVAPLWSDGTTCASQRFPTWAGDVLVVGAYLDAAFVAPRLGLSHMMELVPALAVLHPGSTLVQITGMQGAVSYWRGNRRVIARMAADLIQEAQRHGLSVALLTRKDGERPLRTTTCEAVLSELRGRGDTTTVIIDVPDETPDPKRIPVVTYGAIGLNSYQPYTVLISLVAYHVDERALSEAAFGAQSPDQRPRVMMKPRRRPVVEKGGDREAVAKAYFMVEVSVLLQALARVRFTIAPRIAVFFSPHNLDPYLGKTTRVGRPGLVGSALGLGLERTDRPGRAVQAYQGGASAAAIARQMGVAERTVRRWLLDFGVLCRRGRPPSEE